MYEGKTLAKIHIGKKELGFTDDEYRDFLFGLTGMRSSKELNQPQRLLVVREMKKRGALKFKKRPLTGQQKAAVAKWYKLRALGEVNSKDKQALNRFIKERFGVWNVQDLDMSETNKLLGMLQAWIDKAEHTPRSGHEPVVEEWQDNVRV